MIERGNLVLAWNGNTEIYAKKYIYIATLKGAVKPYACVSKSSELAYASGNGFHITQYENMRKLETTGLLSKEESISTREVNDRVQQEGLISSQEIEDILELSPTGVRNLFHSGRLQRTKVGFRTFVTPTDLDELIEKRRTKEN